MKRILQIIIVISFVVPTVTIAGELDIYDPEGKAVVYIDPVKQSAIYTWSGDAVAYLFGECGPQCLYIYTWEGSHIGYFAYGIVFDLQGDMVGSLQQVLNKPFSEPGAKQAQNAQYPKSDRYAPSEIQPPFSYNHSKWSLKDFMTQDNM